MLPAMITVLTHIAIAIISSSRHQRTLTGAGTARSLPKTYTATDTKTRPQNPLSLYTGGLYKQMA